MIFLLIFGFVHATLQCETPEDQKGKVTALLQSMVASVDRPGLDSNPSVLIALRLSQLHNLEAEARLLEGVKRELAKRLCTGEELSSGLLALHIMSLSASCSDPSHFIAHGKTINLFDVLLSKVREETHTIDTVGYPSSNYYQFSLDILALCANNVNSPPTALNHLVEAALADNFTHGDRFSVDTGSVAILALVCVKERRNDCFPPKANEALEKLVQQILESVNDDGTIGNLYSTGQAIEALQATTEYFHSDAWNCSRSIQKLLDEIPKGSFNRPQAASQVAPTLQGQTLLNVNRLDCANDTSDLPISPSTAAPLTTPGVLISVNYTITDAIHSTFTDSVTVEIVSGQVLFKALEKAEAMYPNRFSFDFTMTSWGESITKIRDLSADSSAHTYWQFLSGTEPIPQGVGSYTPTNGEHITARFTTW